MLKRLALMDSISANLLNYLKLIAGNLSLPQKKFLKDSFICLVHGKLVNGYWLIEMYASVNQDTKTQNSF